MAYYLVKHRDNITVLFYSLFPATSEKKREMFLMGQGTSVPDHKLCITTQIHM
jgi:hypothetical protein